MGAAAAAAAGAGEPAAIGVATTGCDGSATAGVAVTCPALAAAPLITVAGLIVCGLGLASAVDPLSVVGKRKFAMAACSTGIFGSARSCFATGAAAACGAAL